MPASPPRSERFRKGELLASRDFVFTSESVSEGHPDKICDRISDAIVDTFLTVDPQARCGVETLVTTNRVVLAGEVRGPASINSDKLIEVARNAIREIAALPISYAGHQVCEGCHTEVLDVKSKGVHKGVACESCHGSLAKHADDPTSLQPPKIDVAVLCVRCHEANSAKPKDFPQVASADHSGGVACDTCHKPHSPKIDSGASQ